MWDFSCQTTWFNQENCVYSMYCPCGKMHELWLEKEDILCIIEADLRDIRLCHKKKFDKRVSFFDHLQQKATCSSIIHHRLMQYLLILYPDHVKVPQKK